MNDALDSVNPIVWVQFRLLGGGRRLAWICAICVGGFAVAASALWRITGGTNFAAFCGNSLNVVGIMLAAMLVIGGANAVHRAVRKDQTTRMLESHRLSPLTGVQALIGYLIGPCIQILVLFAFGTFIGAYLAYVAKVPVGSWIVAAAYLLVAAVMVWSLSLVHALSTSRGGNPILALILVSAFGGFAVISTVPGLALLLGVNVWMFAAAQVTGIGGGGLPAHLLAAFAAEAAITAFWWFAIVRKFRRPDRPPFEIAAGIAFFILTLIISVVGFVLRAGLQTTGDIAAPGLAVIATILLAMLVALVPLYGAEFVRAAGRRNARRAGVFEHPFVMVALLTAMIVGSCALMLTVSRGTDGAGDDIARPTARDWAVVAFVTLAWLIGSAGVLRILLAIRYRAVIMPMALWTFVLWGIPPFIEQIRRFGASLATDEEPVWSALLTCSPAGALVAQWNDMNLALWPGLTFQAVAALAALGFGQRMMRIRRAALDAPPALRDTA